MLMAMHAVFAADPKLQTGPWLPRIVTEYARLFPEEKTAIVDALNDTSHGVFLDPKAAALWKQHYLAALQLDQPAMNSPAILAARKRWRNQTLTDAAVLLSRLGPELSCELPSAKVRIAMLGKETAVRFDLNTVQPGILRLILGITESEVASCLAARNEKPFADPEDFRVRSGLKPGTLRALEFDRKQ
jgi:hypothetical protein